MLGKPPESGPAIMREATQSLKELVEVIEEGVMGKTVIIPIVKAALALRIPMFTLYQMGERGQELGVSVAEGNISIRLYGSQSERKKAYNFLYGFLQSIPQGTTEIFLSTQSIPRALSEELPNFDQIVGLINAGTGLPEEDVTRLQIQLAAQWTDLRDRDNLPEPWGVFAAVSY